jgi:hypothetical protein
MPEYSHPIESIGQLSRGGYNMELSDATTLDSATNSLKSILEKYFGKQINGLKISDTSIPFEIKKRTITAIVDDGLQKHEISYDVVAAEDYPAYLKFYIDASSEYPKAPLDKIFEAL